MTASAVVLLMVAGVLFVGFVIGLLVLLLTAQEATGLILLTVAVLVGGCLAAIVALGRRTS